MSPKIGCLKRSGRSKLRRNFGPESPNFRRNLAPFTSRLPLSGGGLGARNPQIRTGATIRATVTANYRRKLNHRKPPNFAENWMFSERKCPNVFENWIFETVRTYQITEKFRSRIPEFSAKFGPFYISIASFGRGARCAQSPNPHWSHRYCFM